jgi:hypothetical protein
MTRDEAMAILAKIEKTEGVWFDPESQESDLFTYFLGEAEDDPSWVPNTKDEEDLIWIKKRAEEQIRRWEERQALRRAVEALPVIVLCKPCPVCENTHKHNRGCPIAVYDVKIDQQAEVIRTIRQAVKDRGCGGRHTHGIDGDDFDCDHDYPWDCDRCPCNDKEDLT